MNIGSESWFMASRNLSRMNVEIATTTVHMRERERMIIWLAGSRTNEAGYFSVVIYSYSCKTPQKLEKLST